MNVKRTSRPTHNISKTFVECGTADVDNYIYEVVTEMIHLSDAWRLNGSRTR